MPLPPRKSIDVTAPRTVTTWPSRSGIEVARRVAVGVVDGVDARLGDGQQRRRRRRRRAEVHAAARRDVVAGVERPQEVVLLHDADDGEGRRRA